MLTRGNFRQPSQTSSISSSSSLSSASFSSDSCLSSTSGSSSSYCTCYSDRIALERCRSLQANSILSCNSYNSQHTLECLYASLAISSGNSKNVTICRSNNCKCAHQINNSTVQPVDMCNYLMILNSSNDRNCHCANCNKNLIHPHATWSSGMLISSNNNNHNSNSSTNGGHEYSSSVKGEEVNNRSRINSSGISKKCELCTTSSSPFASASQVTLSGRESNFLNSNLTKASASPSSSSPSSSSTAAGEKFKSDTCQMTQLINESK